MFTWIQRSLTYFSLISVLGASTASAVTTSSSGAGYRSVVYYPNYEVYNGYNPSNIPVQSVNYINYVFANVNPTTGQVYLSDNYTDITKLYPGDSSTASGTNVYGAIKQLNLLKKHNRYLKVLLSIGGWDFSPNVTPALSTASGQQSFASSAVKLLQNYGFDGLDIDWEYPTDATQAAAFVSMLSIMRSLLDQYATSLGTLQYGSQSYTPHFYISIAAPAGSDEYKVLDIPGMAPYLDIVNLMGYDFAGSWDTVTGHQANLYPDAKIPASTPDNSRDVIDYYLDHGITPDKLVLGMPLYGRAFEKTVGPALGNKFKGVGANDGIYAFNQLPRTGAKEYYNPIVGAAWSYDSSAQELISYDTSLSVLQKTQYVQDNLLGGVMFWEAAFDKTGADSLIMTAYNKLSAASNMDSRINVISYPLSIYDNLRNGFPGQ